MSGTLNDLKSHLFRQQQSGIEVSVPRFSFPEKTKPPTTLIGWAASTSDAARKRFLVGVGLTALNMRGSRVYPDCRRMKRFVPQ